MHPLLSNLLRHLGYRRKPGPILGGAGVPMRPVTAPEPVISDLARGIVKSIEVEPEAWTWTPPSSRPGSTGITHSPTGMLLLWEKGQRAIAARDGHGFTHHETTLIERAYDAHVRSPRQAAWASEAQARITARNAHFLALAKGEDPDDLKGKRTRRRAGTRKSRIS